MSFKSIILFLIEFSSILSLNSLEVKTSSGVVRGKAIEVLNKTVNQYLNIPYAEPPVGRLRFSKPVPLRQPIKGVIDGTKVGHSCLQNDPSAKSVSDSENCLVLNVWSSGTHNSSELKPVMFYIHGGAFRTGSIFLPLYNGKVLATYDVVVVSTNYRLGPFGGLYGGDESAPGNVLFYDQLLALKWTQQNIGSFGGDPNTITIFGQSAGGWSTSAHVLSPLSKGLFKRAIIQSGTFYDYKNVGFFNKTIALSEAKAMAKHLNCSSQKEWLDCLRKVDAKDLNNYYDLTAYIIPDTEFMPSIAQKVFKTQNYSTDIDIIAGVMQNEGGLLAHLFLPKSDKLNSKEEFINLIKSLHFPELNYQKILGYYLKNIDTNSTESLKKAFYGFYGDILITCRTYFFAKQFAKQSPKRNVFFYEWTQVPHLLASPMGCYKDMGICHGSELEYVFGLSVLQNNSDIKFSKDVMTIWTNFAKNGNPLEGFPSDVHWPRMVNTDNNIIKVKELNALKANQILENPFEKTCEAVWNNYFD